MNISVFVTSPRRTRDGRIAAVLCFTLLVGCQSPNVFTAKNDAESSAAVQTASATSQPAGLPTPTNTDSPNSSQSLTSVDEHLRLGELELEQGNYSQAQMHFDHVLQKHPDHVKANHRLGVLTDKLGQYSRAEEYYFTALQGDPRNAALLSDLGYSYWLQRRYPESERYLLEARRFDPNYKTAVANLGLLYGSTGRQEEARAMLGQIGDDAEVRQIMQQIASGQLQPPQQSVVEPFASPQQTSVVTTQTTAQHAAQVLPQDMNAATREFVEQMRQAREELRRAEERLAVQQAQGTVMPSSQGGLSSAAGQQPPAWARQAASSRGDGRPEPQSAGVTPFSGQYAQQAARNGQSPDAVLAERMATIDRRDQQSFAGGPLVVGPLGSSAQATNSQPWSQGELPITQGNPSYVSRVSPQTPLVNEPPYQQRTDGATVVATAPQHWPPRGTNQPPAQSDRTNDPIPYQPPPAGNAFAHHPGSSAAGTPPSAWGQQFATSLGQSSPPQPVSSGLSNGVTQPYPVQQSSASGSRYAQRPVEYAYHTQQPGQRPDISLAGQTDAPAGALVPPSLSGYRSSQPQQSNVLTSSGSARQPVAANSYEQARREAALMGLGAGPGQVFPYIQQTPRAMPGTDSRINGAQYPAPVRHMPTGLAPPDWNPGFSGSPPANRAPAYNDLGQPMPPIPVPTNDPAAHPVSSSAYFQQYQHTGHDAAVQRSQMTRYQDTRVQQSAQLNGLINQTWGQSPQSPPYGVTPPSTTSQYAAPTTHPMQAAAPTMPWNPHNPAATGSSRMTYQASGAAAQTHNVSPQNQGPVVVPEPYRSNQPAPTGDYLPNSQGQSDRGRAANARPYEGPVIVPARR